MKKSFCFKMLLSMVFMLLTVFCMNAQNYHSKPTAIQNLADESKYLYATFNTLENTDNNAFQRNKEKQRIIKNILKSIKSGASVQEAVESNVPSEELNTLSVAINDIPLPENEKSTIKWIRKEILPLVTY